jgi:hypothetical protein
MVRDLFSQSVPRTWEIVALSVRDISRRPGRLVVSGVCHCRLKDVDDVVRVPFIHVWHLRDGLAVRVVSSLDAVELRRAA